MRVQNSKYFFAIGASSVMLVQLKQFFNSRPYLKAKNNRTPVFDEPLKTAVAEYQKHHKLKDATGFLNEETYAKIGEEMTVAQVDVISKQDFDLQKLLFGVGLQDLCAGWENVSPVIPKDKFIGWGAAGIRENCFDYARQQLISMGFDLKSPGWGTSTRISPDIYQLYVSQNVAGFKPGHQAQQFTTGISYLKKAIKSKIPVMAGVDDDKGSPNRDKVTDHYVVIVGMGSDSTGNYFSFYDNATGDTDMGTSDKNRLYCDCKQFVLKGTGEAPYIQKTDYKSYVVTQIRETK